MYLYMVCHILGLDYRRLPNLSPRGLAFGKGVWGAVWQRGRLYLAAQDGRYLDLAAPFTAAVHCNLSEAAVR